ncbi:MAG: hypothetical protein IKH27_06860 [Oscillospiraceae bacterium]|nr:hypothetical protein [Oscillospiraceae bacterium]
MRSYEETIRRVHSRIAVYEAERKTKRERIAGAAAAVTPVCLAAAVGVGLWRSGAISPAEIRQTGELPVTPVTETAVSVRSSLLTTAPVSGTSAAPQTAASSCLSALQQTAAAAGTESPERPAAETVSAGDIPAEAAVTKADEPQRIHCYDGTDAPAATAQTRTVTKPAVTETRPVQTEPAVGNGPCLREGDEPPVYRNLITSYPIGCSADYRAPYDGEVCYTVPLFYAMQEYGADADYMVIIDLYSGARTANSKRLYELADLRTEFDRLGALGYEAGLNQPSNAAPFLTLHATYEELQNFPAAADRGYFLRLYMEDEPSCLPGAYNE